MGEIDRFSGVKTEGKRRLLRGGKVDKTMRSSGRYIPTGGVGTGSYVQKDLKNLSESSSAGAKGNRLRQSILGKSVSGVTQANALRSMLPMLGKALGLFGGLLVPNTANAPTREDMEHESSGGLPDISMMSKSGGGYGGGNALRE